MINSAKSLSFTQRWFSNSVHTLDTNESCSNFAKSSISEIVNLSYLKDLF